MPQHTRRTAGLKGKLVDVGRALSSDGRRDTGRLPCPMRGLLDAQTRPNTGSCITNRLG
jgi:hypothetical protein